ncbi:MAG: ATP-binding protein [Flammeovirgaceae bacterium]
MGEKIDHLKMTFSSIPGLSEIKSTLIKAVQANHIAHAQLFAGQPGALNLPLALAYVTYLHCQNKKDNDACGTCPACSKSLKFIHPDTSFVFPFSNVKNDKDEDRFKAEIVKTWRSFLLEQPFGDLGNWISYYGGEDKQALISREESREIIKTLSLKPFESPFKIMIIWQPEWMHPSAANGILKILEEPPANTFFILISNATEKLLPTILSRTQIVLVPMLTDDELGNYLAEKGYPDEGRTREAIRMAEGDINFALKRMELEEDSFQDRFVEWMRSCHKKDYVSLVAIAEGFHELDKLGQRGFLHYSNGLMRETLLYSVGAKAISRARGSEADFLQNFNKVMSVEKVDKACNLLNEASYHVERNGSAKMIFLDLSIQLSQIIKG